MELCTFQHDTASGWSVDRFPDLDSDRTLVLVFGASEYIDASTPLSQLIQAYPQARVLGCSTAGEIHGTHIKDHTLAVAIARFKKISLGIASAQVAAPTDSYRSGRHIGNQLYRPDLRSTLVLSDGLQVNGSELVRGINETLPSSVVVTGGLAGDGDRFRRTWALHDGIPQSSYVTAVGFYGEGLQVGHGSKGGWDIFGPERLVTRSQGNVLYELDGKPALQLYKEYLGDRASGLPATGLLFPLALRSSPTDEKSLVRTILAIDETTQSLTFAGDIQTGARAQLMRANFDRLVQGASEAAALTTNGHRSASPTLAIAISCVGRRLVLGERSEEETEATMEVLPPNTQQIGFYSYGELSPYAQGSCDLHNQTMTLTMITEV